MLRNRSALLAAALLGVGAGLPGGALPLEYSQPSVPLRTAFGSSESWTGTTNPKRGPTTAQQKRAARKARNVRRHKKHVRGAK